MFPTIGDPKVYISEILELSNYGEDNKCAANNVVKTPPRLCPLNYILVFGYFT
jgi:hypothetical protein